MQTINLNFILPKTQKFDFDSTVLESIARAFENFGEGMKPAIMRALNRAVDGMPPDITKRIAAEYSLPVRRIRATLSVSHADLKGMTATVTMRSGAFALYLFGAAPKQPGPNKGPVTVDVMGRKEVPGGVFIARMKTGHIGVWKRTGNSPRLPMHELFGPSVVGMWSGMEERSNDAVNDAVIDATEQRFNVRLPHEVDRLLAQMGAR